MVPLHIKTNFLAYKHCNTPELLEHMGDLVMDAVGGDSMTLTPDLGLDLFEQIRAIRSRFRQDFEQHWISTFDSLQRQDTPSSDDDSRVYMGPHSTSRSRSRSRSRSSSESAAPAPSTVDRKNRHRRSKQKKKRNGKTHGRGRGSSPVGVGVTLNET